jgi:hypothetical protein
MGREQLIDVINGLGAATFGEFLLAKQVNKAHARNKTHQKQHEANGVIERDAEVHRQIRRCWGIRKWR